jgi:hypothetical protein
MLAGSIANGKLANSTISGISLGGTLNTLTLGTGLGGTSYNGSAAVTASVSYGTAAGTACQGNDSRLSDTRNTTNSLTFNNGGAGAVSGTTFNGSAAQTISFNTIGAPSTTGTNASGTWAIGITGNAATVSNGVYTTGDQTIGGAKTFSSTVTLSSNTPIIELNDQDSAVDNRRWTLRCSTANELSFQGLTDAGAGGGNLFTFIRSAQQIQSFQGRSAGTSWFTIDNSTSRVGIGTVSPSQLLHTSQASGANVFQQDSGTVGSILYTNSASTGGVGTRTNHDFAFVTNNTERGRITATGDIRLFQSATSTPGLSNTTTGVGLEISSGALFLSRADSAGNLWLNSNAASGTSTHATFSRSGTSVGTISTTTTTTSYNTTSDYRLKENVKPFDDALTLLKQLKPVRFNFLVDPNHSVNGFLAHEVQEVVPEAVTGSKDAVDDNGNPVYQGIDQSKLIPLLTRALQEAVLRIEQLENEVQSMRK